MRNEVLRMERVTYKEDEVVKLEDFNLCLLYTSDAADEL